MRDKSAGQIVRQQDLKATIQDGWMLRCGCLHLHVRRLLGNEPSFITVRTAKSKGCTH